MRRVAGCIAAIAVLGACTGHVSGLPPLDNVDRVSVGEYEAQRRREVLEASEIAGLVAFANSLRSGTWAQYQTVHGGGTVIRFYGKGQLQGYLSTDFQLIYTNAEGMEAARKTTREEVAALLSLIPPHAKH